MPPLAAALVALAPILAATILGAAAPAGEVLPGPVVVEPGPADGQLRIEPTALVRDLDPADGAVISLTLSNGSASDLTFAIEPREVAAGPDGAPRIGTGTQLPNAVPWLQLPGSDVRLLAGERATIPIAVVVPRGAKAGGYVAALTARSDEVDPPVEVATTLVIRVAETTPPQLQVTPRATSAGAAVEMRLTAPAGAVIVAARLTATSWAGTRPLDEEYRTIVVLPDVPRVVRASFPLPAVPGGYRIDARTATASGDSSEATATLWLWHRGLLIAVAAGLLLATVVAVLRTSRPRRALP